MTVKINNDYKNKIVLTSFIIFLIPVFILFIIKVYTLVKSFDLYVTSGAEITTLNFIYNFLNGNNLLNNKEQNIFYEFYGLNFHLFYWPFIKFFEFLGLSYFLSTRLITFGFLLLLTTITILISKKISIKDFIFRDNFYLFYFFILTFLINHQTSSWWILTYRPDILAIFFSFLGIYFFILFIENNNKYIFFWSLVFCVLSWTFKQNFLFVLSSIFIYLLIKKRFDYIILKIVFIVLIFSFLYLITGYNNLDLLNRSPLVVASQLEFENYFKVLLKYFIKNPYLILFILIPYLASNEGKDNKRLFFYITIFFLFLQSSFVAVLHGAGINHLMIFSFFIIISISFINNEFIKKYFILTSFFLLISSTLNYFQLFNYNKFGRQGLYFDIEEKKQLREFKNFIEYKIDKPLLVIGASNRTEMFLSENLVGKDTFQVVSFIDPAWRKWLFRPKNEMDKNETLFKDKFKKIKSSLILNNKNENTKSYIDFLEKNNFKYEKTFTLFIYENRSNLNNLKDLLNFEKGRNIHEFNILYYKKITS